jgi:ketosteroid isomerase-like protein
MVSLAARFDSAANSGLPSGTPMVSQTILRSTHKSRFLVVAVLCSLVTLEAAAIPVVRHDPKKKATRETVEKLEEQWRQAQLNGDAATMDRLLSDDFVGITASGEVRTKAQQLARLHDRVVVLSRLELTDIKVKLIGPIVAVVTSRAEVAGTSDGAPINGAFRYTRVYQRLPGGMWKITSFEATRVPADGNRVHSEAEAAHTPHP